MLRRHFAAVLAAAAVTTTAAMSRQERRALRDEAAALFTHGYDSYMKHAFPADTLKPLSCAGADDWGSMSLTLLDTMDTLALMGNATEFERGVRYCVEHLSFDRDDTVSVFETNIRALGGLISAHLLALDPRLGLMSGPCASGWEAARLPCLGDSSLLPWPPGAGPPGSRLRHALRASR